MKSSIRSLTRLTPVLGLDPTSYFFSADIKARRSRHIHKWPSNKLSWQPTLPVFLTFSRIFFSQLISVFSKLSAVFRFKLEAAAKLNSLVSNRKYSEDCSAWSVAVVAYKREIKFIIKTKVGNKIFVLKITITKTVNSRVMKNRMGWCSPEQRVAMSRNWSAAVDLTSAMFECNT